MRILPKALEISPRGISNKLKEAIYDFGVEESYRVAAHRLQVHYGFSLSPERIREKTLEKLQEIDKELAERKSITALPSQGAAAIIAQCDGAMVCTVTTGSGSDRRKKRTLEWKEARLCAATAQGSVTIFYEGLIGDVNETGKRWCHAAYRAGWAAETYLHPMGDGAPWIEEQARHNFPGSRFLLDLYHVCDYLASAADTCTHKEKPNRWLKRQKNKLRKGKTFQVIEELNQKQEPPHILDEDAPVRAAYRYLSHRIDQLFYDEALARDLPVGTGMIESAHKQIIQKRLKGPGMAWNLHNAHLMIQARAVRATNIQNPKCQKIAA